MMDGLGPGKGKKKNQQPNEKKKRKNNFVERFTTGHFTIDMRFVLLSLLIASFFALVAVAAGDGTPPVCKCTGAGSCAPAQLIDAKNFSCPTPINGVLNASIVTTEFTQVLTLDPVSYTHLTLPTILLV